MINLLLFLGIFLLGLYLLPSLEVDEDGNEDFTGRDLKKEKEDKKRKQEETIKELRG